MRSTLLDLADELILAIVARTRPTPRDLSCLGATCRRLFRLCRDDSLWRLILVDTVGAAAAREASQRSTCRALVLWLLFTEVRVVVHPVSASVAAGSRLVDGRVTMHYGEQDRPARSYNATLAMDIVCAENPNQFVVRLLGLTMTPPLGAHVWLVEPLGPRSYRPLRFIHPLPDGWRLYRTPWWLAFYDGALGRRQITLDFLVVCVLERFNARVPPCVTARMEATTPGIFDNRVASAPTWYAGSLRKLCHLCECDCRCP